MLHVYNIGSAARIWMRDQLYVNPTGNLSLPVSSMLSEGYDFSDEAGSILALAVPNAGQGLTDFHAGRTQGFGPIAGLPAVTDKIAELLIASLTPESKLVCLIDELLCGPQDSNGLITITDFSSNVFLCDGAIVYCLSAVNSDRQVILDIIKNTFVHGFVCGLFYDPSGFLVGSTGGHTVSLDELRIRTRDVRGIVIEAYDLEGSLIWTPRQFPPNFESSSAHLNPWIMQNGNH